MSVLVPDLMVYEYVHNGLQYAANNKTCDALYASCISVHMKRRDWDKECIRLIRAWAKLNVDSYNIKYGEKEEGMPYWMCVTGNKRIPIDAYQLLMYVECIAYNIEPGTIEDVRPLTHQEKEDYELLKRWEDQIKTAIIKQLKEYKAAKWSTY